MKQRVEWDSLAWIPQEHEVSNLHKSSIKEISPGETLSDWEKSRMWGRSKARVPFQAECHLQAVPAGDS